MSNCDEKNKNDISCKVVFLGRAKKTGIIKKFIGNNYSFTSLGSNNYNKTMFFPEEKKNINFEIWDTAGKEEFRDLTRCYYRNKDVAILVYNITNHGSFEDLKNYWIKEVKENNENKEFSKIIKILYFKFSFGSYWK